MGDEMKATVRPWRYGLVPEESQRRHIQEGQRSGDRYFIAPKNGGSDICEVHHTYERGDSGTSLANAELIVKAVNSYREWQPIETAPRDGTVVMLWWPYWRSRTVIGYYQSIAGTWCSNEALSDHEPPTHWQPLPPPPEAAEQPD